MERQRNISKRLFSILLSLIMVLSLLCLLSGIFGNTGFGLTAHAATTGVTFKAVDGTSSSNDRIVDNKGTIWGSNFSGSAYVVIKASEPVYVSGYTITTGAASLYPDRNPKAWTLSACNDFNEESKTSENWTVIDKVTNAGLPASMDKTISFTLDDSSVPYKYYKLDITEIVGGNRVDISEMAFTYTTCDHNWVEFGESVTPSCIRSGYTSQKCSVCGHVRKTNIVDALGHEIADGVCTRCGVSDPTPKEPAVENGKYQIGTAGELYWFAGLVNGTLEGVTQNTSANAELTADITVNNTVFDENGNLNKELVSWTPIGSPDKPYTGVFDGNSHTVGGLCYNNADGRYIGLFSFLGGNGKITNVGVVDSYFKGAWSIGGVCGCNEGGTVSYCYNTASVNGGDHVGGVCGQTFRGSDSTPDTRMYNCYNKGSVSGVNYIGGLSGHCYNSAISDCFNSGTLKGNSYVGGIVGQRNYVSPIQDCYSVGKIYGNDTVGGIIGPDSTNNVTNCYYLEGCNAEGTTFTSPAGTSKTLDAFTSGEIAFLLQGTNFTVGWGQNIDNGEPVEEYPVLGGAKVYEVSMYSCKDSNTLIGLAYSNKEGNYIKHETTPVNEKAPSCTEDGNIEYYECSDCGKLFADAAGRTEITANDVVDKATGHDYKWIVDKGATETESGSKHEECRNCGDQKTTVVIPPTVIPPTATVQSEDALKVAIESFASIKLDQDIELSSDLDLSDKTMTLDLNGHTLKGNIKLADSTAGADSILTLVDSSPSGGGVVNGKITLTRGDYGNASHLYANGGTITGNVSLNSYVGGIFCTSNTPTNFKGSVGKYGEIHGGIFYSNIETSCIKENTVTFVKDGTTYAVEVVAEGRNVVAPVEPTISEGMKFTGWCTEDALTTPYKFGRGLTENITLYGAIVPITDTDTDTDTDHDHDYVQKHNNTDHWDECACGDKINVEGHKYRIVSTTKATTSKNGNVKKECSVCGDEISEIIYYPKAITISSTSYTYDGKTKTPTVKVTDAKGNTISSGNYTVTYASGRKNVGSYKVTVTLKGNYEGSKALSFNIKPKGTSISKLSKSRKAFTVKWKKQSSKMAKSTITGYQIRYSTSSKMTGAKTKTVKGYKYTSKKITKLKAKKKYYVQVRTYKTVSGKNYYSSWSKVKSVKTK